MFDYDKSRAKRAIFIGSSVCVGEGATANQGWSAMAARRLAAAGWQTSNCAIGGQRTGDILLRLERDVLVPAPAVCFVGLGLSNEGLSQAENPREPAAVFRSNLSLIASTLEAAGVLPVLGGVYPNNDYTPEQTQALRRMHEEMLTWPYWVLPFLPALDDGHGHYRPGDYSDAWHPSDAGYRKMMESIPQALWAALGA